jgi:hypothetical protein
MASSIINATVDGLQSTGGNTAELELQVGGTTAITVNSAGYWVLTNPLPVASGGTGSNTGAFSGANITSINANNISSGTLAVAQGGTGSGTATFSGANITSLNASSITSGTLDNARTTASSSNGANTIVQRDASGNFTANVITANGSSITSINAANISSGTLSVARGGTGAATLDANNVILGNGTSAVQFVAPGTASNVLTSNGTTWVSQAAGGGGGVSSVNGQTGAVVTTNLGGIGAVTIGWYGITNPNGALTNRRAFIARGTSIAGTNIRVPNAPTATNSSTSTTGQTIVPTVTSSNTSFTGTGVNSTTLTGTWTSLNGTLWSVAPGGCTPTYEWYAMLFVRVS